MGHLRAKWCTGKGSCYASCQGGIDGRLSGTIFEGEGSNMSRGGKEGIVVEKCIIGEQLLHKYISLMSLLLLLGHFGSGHARHIVKYYS